jgi:hypothetical protein
MLTAPQVEAYLRQFEPLKHVIVEEENKVIFTPWFVKLSGNVSIQGEIHAFETDLDLREFAGNDDLMKLAVQLMRSFEEASRRTA